MNNLQIFSNPQFGEVRALMIDQEPYFVGNDIAMALGYQIPKDAIHQHVDDDEKLLMQMSDIQVGGEIPPPHMRGAKIVVINESGIYSLVFGSKLPQAKAFKKWVTSEVLPSIRKNGGYMVASDSDTPDEIMAKALIIASEALKKRDDRIANLISESHAQQSQIACMNDKIIEMKQKTDYLEIILSSKETICITQIAKDYGMSAKRFNQLLYDLKVQHKVNGQWILYSKYINEGYVHSKTVQIVRSNGCGDTVLHTEWRQKGRIFLYNLLKNNGIIPTIEK